MSSWKKSIVYNLSETFISSKSFQLPPNGLPNAGCRALDAGSFRQRHRQRDAVDFEESVGLKKFSLEKSPSKDFFPAFFQTRYSFYEKLENNLINLFMKILLSAYLLTALEFLRMTVCRTRTCQSKKWEPARTTPIFGRPVSAGARMLLLGSPNLRFFIYPSYFFQGFSNELSDSG